MKVICRTNLDLHPSETWPEEFPEGPLVGDYVFSSWSNLRLVVVSRNWIIKPGVGPSPILEVELHCQNMSVYQFQSFYKRWVDNFLEEKTRGGILKMYDKFGQDLKGMDY